MVEMYAQSAVISKVVLKENQTSVSNDVVKKKKKLKLFFFSLN